MVLDRIIDLARFRLQRGKRRHLALADRARDAGQWQLAAQLYRQALDRNPRNAAIWVQYGHALKESGGLRDPDKLAQAEIAYRTALSLDPGGADTYVQLGHVLKLYGKTEEAQAAYLQAFVLDKSTPYPVQELGELGWSEAHLAELQGMLANGSSPENCRPVTERQLLGAQGYNVSLAEGTLAELSGLGSSELRPPDRQGLLENEPSPRFSLDMGGSDQPQISTGDDNKDTQQTWSGRFDPGFYLNYYPDVARVGMDPLDHFLRYGLKEGRIPVAVNPGICPAATDAEIRCLKMPSFGEEMALFVTHSPYGSLRPHVPHYLESLKRQGISVVLIVNSDAPVAALRFDLQSKLDGLFVRQNIGYDFAAWAHILRLHPELFNAKIVYLLNESLIGPTDDSSFCELLTRLRDSPADFIGLTENFDRGWHLQSYFLTLKHRALSSVVLRRFINSVVCYKDLEDVHIEYEIRFASILKAAGLSCETMFPAADLRDPTIYRWKHLLESGFPFIKVKTIRDVWGVDVSDWRELLAARGYDASLAERTLAEFAASTSATAGILCRKFPTDIRQWAKEIVLEPPATISLPRPLGIFVHIYYEDLADEIAGYLARIDAPTRIYISTKPEVKRTLIRAAFERHDLGQVTEIISVPNYGSDIAPFLIEFIKKFNDHDICLKIHSKKSLNQPPEFGEGWRSHLFHELMCDSERVRSIINTMLAHPDVGVLIPQLYDYPGIGPGKGDIGPNYENMQRILAKIDINLLPDQEIYFPVGSMFWFRGKALAGLAGLGFDWLDFGCAIDQRGCAIDQRDGTLAHGMERCILFFSAKAGMKWGFLPPFQEAT